MSTFYDEFDDWDDDDDEYVIGKDTVLKAGSDDIGTGDKTVFHKIRDKFVEVISKHPTIIGDVKLIVDTFVKFRKDKDPLIFVDGGFTLLDAFKATNFANAWSFLDKTNLEELYHKNVNIAFLFYDILPSYPHHIIKFVDNSFIKVFTTPKGELYLYSASRNENYLYYDSDRSNLNDLIKVLVDDKLKTLNSNFLIYHKPDDAPNYSLTTFTPNMKVSKKAQEYLKHIKKFTDAGMTRSILFYGPPGTGKTTLASTMLGHLNYRTLIFSASYKINTINVLNYIIELFDIEAVVIDDFDQLGDSGQLLDLLEMLNRKMKLVVGIANSLRGFHPAVLRPGRFDEVELITSLDDECIKGVLGKLSKDYMKLVKHWPIAYINELVKRSKFSTKAQLKKHYEELNQRVNDQLDSLSD